MHGPLVDALQAEALRREPGRTLPPFPQLWREPWVGPWLKSLPLPPDCTARRTIWGTDGPPAPLPFQTSRIVVPLGQTLDAAMQSWAVLAALDSDERGTHVWQAQSWHRMAWCRSVMPMGRN